MNGMHSPCRDCKPVTERPRLPATRLPGKTHKAVIYAKDEEVIFYITTSHDDKGRPVELFIRGSLLARSYNAWAVAMSILLQTEPGALESLCRKFAHERFPPSGPTADKRIGFTKSVVDYIARWLAVEYLPADVARSMGAHL